MARERKCSPIKATTVTSTDIIPYLSRGHYADQLAIWMKLFPRDQMLILRSEDFFAEPPRIFQKVLRFLDLPPWELGEYKQYNAREYSTMDAATQHTVN